MEFKPLIGITYEFIFQLVNTFLVFFLLKKLLFKPVLGIIEAREKDIREDLAQGERAKKEGLSLKSEYEENIYIYLRLHSSDDSNGSERRLYSIMGS